MHNSIIVTCCHIAMRVINTSVITYEMNPSKKPSHTMLMIVSKKFILVIEF
jgi:hypothetical protein